MLFTKYFIVINYQNSSKNKIFLHTNTFNYKTNIVLSFSKTLEFAYSVIYNSVFLKSSKINYLVYKKRLLVIVKVLKKFYTNLLNSYFTIFTNIKELRWYKIWMEEWSEAESLYFYLGWKSYWIWCKTYESLLNLLRY